MASRCPKRKAIVLENGKLGRGVPGTMAALFYPTYVAPRGVSSLPPKKARCLGKYVDTTVTAMVNGVRLKPKQVRWANLVYKALAEKQLVLAQSQYSVGCSQLRMGTDIDMIAEFPDKTLAVVENKVGFEKYWTVSQGKMRAPLDHLDNCPQKQHWLQAAMNAYLLTRSLPNHKPIKEVLVLRLNTDASGYEWSKVPDGLITEDVLKELAASQSWNRAKRARVKRRRLAQSKSEA